MDCSKEYNDRWVRGWANAIGALSPQAAGAQAQEAGRYLDEIVSVSTTMAVTDKETGQTTERVVTVDRDTCNRPGTTYESLAKLNPVKGDGKFVTAGNASQLSDGASACWTMTPTAWRPSIAAPTAPEPAASPSAPPWARTTG